MFYNGPCDPTPSPAGPDARPDTTAMAGGAVRRGQDERVPRRRAAPFQEGRTPAQAVRPAAGQTTWPAKASRLCSSVCWRGVSNRVEIGIVGAGSQALVGFYQPLPAALVLIALALRIGGAGRGVVLPLYAASAMLALLGTVVVWRLNDPGSLGITLFLYAGCLYLVARLEHSIPAAGLALTTLLPAIVALLAWSRAPAALYPPAALAAALAVYGAQQLWRHEPSWRQLHALAGLGIGGLAAFGCLLRASFWWSWSWRPLAALIALLGVAAMLALEARKPRRHFMIYLAAIALSLGALWIARFLGATNPEWYVVVPGLIITASAVRAHRDRDLPSHPIACCRACAAPGCALPLGVSAYLSWADPEPGLHTALLEVESALCVLAAVRIGNRSLAVAGSLGLALGIFRLFTLLAAAGPAPLGLAVLLALALAAGVTARRLRNRVARAWHHWV